MTEFGSLAQTVFDSKYAHKVGGGRKENWGEVSDRIADFVVKPYLPEMRDKVRRFIFDRKLMPGGRYLYATGRRYPQINNCFLFSVEDSREDWARLMHDITSSLMTGGGVGVVYSKIRPSESYIEGMGGKSTGPCALASMVNEAGRHIMQGGSRRSAVWAGLHWNHPDIFKFIALKKMSPIFKKCKEEDFNFPVPMDGTNISVILDSDFFAAINSSKWSKEYRRWGGVYTVDQDWARSVYSLTIRGMREDGEPGFSVDHGENEGENLRNACTEVVSADSGDCCNLASINMAAINDPSEMEEVVEAGIALLLCGTIYSVLPLPSMLKVREKNRRLGLGLMGMHEWLLIRGLNYGPHEEMAPWLKSYTTSDMYAKRWCDRLNISQSVATRSIAPTGTISMVAETTSGIEPVPSVAYKRRYLKGKTWKAQYVIDATAKRLIDKGVDPNKIEDSMTLASDYNRRLEFQAWVQEHVDQGISSTINLPAWGSPTNNENNLSQFEKDLLHHLPKLRGITCYPDGSRGGQPIVRVTYAEAISKEGVEFIDNSENTCKSGVCGV